LVLAIGQANFHHLSITQRAELVSDLAEIYCSDANAGVHAACRWLLDCRLNAGDTVAESDKSISIGVSDTRNWYAGANDHTFVVFRGRRKFSMGSPSFEVSREDDELLHEEPSTTLLRFRPARLRSLSAGNFAIGTSTRAIVPPTTARPTTFRGSMQPFTAGD
jgi:hypothetical protein